MAITVFLDGAECDVNILAYHLQDDPYPGGLYFSVEISGNEYSKLLKMLRRRHSIDKIPCDAAECREIEFALFDFITWFQEPDTSKSYILNRVISVVTEENKCVLSIEGSVNIGA